MPTVTRAADPVQTIPLCRKAQVRGGLARSVPLRAGHMLRRMAEPRRSNRRGRRSREEILDAATRVMAERGYTATSLSTLSKATGLPKSAVYHHFHSKGGLLSAVMARGAYDFFAAMREAHTGGPPAPPANAWTGSCSAPARSSSPAPTSCACTWF
jgi:hypothetical protein